MQMKQKYSRIVNRELKKAEMLLYGDIGDKVDGDYFAQELNWLAKNVDEITIKINSNGGDVVQGLSIVSEIRSSAAFIITHVTGIAASMSAVIAVSGDKRTMNDYAKLMLHSPYYVDKDGKAIEKLSAKDKKALAAIKSTLVDILTNAGKDKEAISKILESETWYDSETAVSEGFVSEVISTKRKDLAALKPLTLVAKLMEELEAETNENSNFNIESMKTIAARLGLAADATEEQIVAAIEKRETEAATALVAQFIAVGEAMGTITANNKEKATRLAKADMELAAEMFLTVADKGEGDNDDGKTDEKGALIKDAINGKKTGGKAAVAADKKWEDLTELEVEDLRENDRATYVAKFKGFYGFEPEVED